MVKRLMVSVIALALIGTACSKKAETSTPPSASGPAGAYVVQVDAKQSGQAINVGATAFFPSALSVHPGDTVVFKSNFSGEPHSVTFGTLVDQGLATASPREGAPEPAALKKIPVMLPTGPGDANPVSVNPCFVASGTLTAASCTTTQPDFNGKYELYNSGFLPGGATFTMKLASDLAPGTYHWFCTLHRASMQGKLTVVSTSQTVPSAADVATQGQNGIEEFIAKLKPFADQASHGMGPGAIFAGGFPPPSAHIPGLATQFGPKAATVHVGQLVKWIILGAHTVDFIPETGSAMMSDTTGVMTKGPDGKWHIDLKDFTPKHSPPANPTKQTGNVVNAGTWNGTGDLNSGFLPGFGPPGYLTWEVKFSKKGTYKYHCAVHPGMDGTITVA
ncbi:MAG: plastocyanin/azurin family copper-binding protein [Actinomycetota bacterium]